MAKKEDKQLVKFKFMNHDRIGTIAAKVDAGTHPYLIYWKEGAYYRSVWLAENQLELLRTTTNELRTTTNELRTTTNELRTTTNEKENR